MNSSNKKKKIISFVRSGKDEDVLDKIYTLVNRESTSSLADHIFSLGIKNPQELSDGICVMDKTDNIHNIIPNLDFTPDDFPKNQKFNLIDFLFEHELVLGLDLLNHLLHIKMDNGSTFIGKGEFLFRLLLKGTSSKYGDFNSEGKIFEIKYGLSRLRGMTGFGSGYNVAMRLNKAFSLKGPASSWNFYTGKRKKEMLINKLISDGHDLDVLCKTYVSSLSEVFLEMGKMDMRLLYNSLRKEFKDNGLKNRNGHLSFTYKVCAHSLKHYQRMEKFDYIVFVNDSFECLIMDASFIISSSYEDLSIFMMDHFSAIVPMSFSEKAGPQGSSFGIVL